MADINDASGIQQAVDRQETLLEDADITEADRDAIERYVRHRRVHGTDRGSYALTTQRNDLCYLRLSAQRGPVPLVEMTVDDLNELLETLQAPTDAGGYGISSGISVYAQTLRAFFQWVDSHDEFRDVDWYEQIGTNTVEFPDPSDRRFPTQDEIDAMVQAARQENNPRNAALVSFISDAAVRRTLCAQLRVGDVDLSGDRPTFTPNAEAVGQKGVDIKPYTLYDCVADLRVYVNRFHPDPDTDDAPLWPKRGYDASAPDEYAVSARQIRSILQDLAETSGLPDDVEVNPHAFRHAAVGRWKERGYSLAQVQRRTAWADSAAADMWAKYGDPDDERIDAEIDKIEGRDPPTDGEGETAEPVERYDCGNCGATGWTTGHCGQCGAPVSPGAKAAVDTAHEVAERLEELAVRLDDPGDRSMALDVKRRVEASPESVDAERVHDLLSELESSVD